MSHAAYNEYIREHHGPMAVSRSCVLCKFFVIRRLGGGGGRGNGFREGNRQRGAMIQHLKTAHPAEYAKAMEKKVA